MGLNHYNYTLNQAISYINESTRVLQNIIDFSYWRDSVQEKHSRIIAVVAKNVNSCDKITHTLCQLNEYDVEFISSNYVHDVDNLIVETKKITDKLDMLLTVNVESL